MGQGLGVRWQMADGRWQKSNVRGWFFCGLPSAICLLMLAACAKPVDQSPLPAMTPKPVAEEVAEAPQLSPRDTARQALELFDKKQYDDAIPLLTQAASAYPEVAPFLRLRIAEAEAARGNVQDAVKILSEIVAISDTSAATVARLRLPALYAQLGDRASTDSAWQQASQLAIDELNESDFVSMATALAKAGRADLATSTRMRLLTTYTQGRYTEQTFDFLKEEVAKLPVAERVALAAKLARYDRYDQALTLLPADAPEARATRIRALFNSRNYATLVSETENVSFNDPALMLTRARAAWRNDQPQLFLAGLDAIEKSYPSSKEAIEAKILRAKYFSTDSLNYAVSVENLTKAIEAGAGDENLWNLGWTYTLWGKYDEALQVFDRYIRTYPDGDWKTNSLFWSAKIHDKLGRTAARDAKAAQIVAEYPFSYYAYRARELWPSISTTETKSLASFPDLDVELAKVNEPRFATVRALQDVGLDRAAAREMRVLADKYADNLGVQFMLADVYVRGGEPFKANGVLQRRFREFVRHGGTNIPRRFWEILFPLAYWDTIQAEAQRRGHDPYLLASIIRQESGFEPTTVSNAGAVGLMQIMPEEASRIGTAGGLGEITRADLFKPETNVAVGAAEYSQKLALMQNNPTLAIAAYNAGEKAVGDWIARTPLDDMDLFIESIPYAETRLYVKTVTRNRNEYRRIYER
jgi:soluble lytic murein transglycosylase